MTEHGCLLWLLTNELNVALNPLCNPHTVIKRIKQVSFRVVAILDIDNHTLKQSVRATENNDYI